MLCVLVSSACKRAKLSLFPLLNRMVVDKKLGKDTARTADVNLLKRYPVWYNIMFRNKIGLAEEESGGEGRILSWQSLGDWFDISLLEGGDEGLPWHHFFSGFHLIIHLLNCYFYLNQWVSLILLFLLFHVFHYRWGMSHQLCRD